MPKPPNFLAGCLIIAIETIKNWGNSCSWRCYLAGGRGSDTGTVDKRNSQKHSFGNILVGLSTRRRMVLSR